MSAPANRQGARNRAESGWETSEQPTKPAHQFELAASARSEVVKADLPLPSLMWMKAGIEHKRERRSKRLSISQRRCPSSRLHVDRTRPMRALFPSSLPGQWPRLNNLMDESEIAMTMSLAVLTTALLFGGMTLYSFGFAAFLFSALPASTAGLMLRRAFPLFYLFVIVTAVPAAALLWSHDTLAAALLAAVAISTVPTRQMLMPSINRATDQGQRRRFKWLHGLSVVISLLHITAAGFALVRLV